MKLRVTSVQRGCVYDGPGIRTTVFLKGCSLHCPWCCNPETISQGEDWFIDDTKCLLHQGIKSTICAECERNDGDRAINQCPFGVCESTSKEYDVEELLPLLLLDKQQYANGGGVTFSGGEPLLQSDALMPLLKQLKQEDIDIAFETTLVAPQASFQNVLPFVDLFIVDLKLQQEAVVPASYLKMIKERISILRSSGKEIVFRLVAVPSMQTYISEVLQKLEDLKITELELLKCHNLAEKKYEKLQKQIHNYSCDIAIFDNISYLLSQNNIAINKLSI